MRRTKILDSRVLTEAIISDLIFNHSFKVRLQLNLYGKYIGEIQGEEVGYNQEKEQRLRRNKNLQF